MPTESLVEASVLQVTTLPGPIVRYESRLLGLLSKGLAGAEGHDRGVESAVLAHNVAERLFLAQNLTV